MAMSSTHGVVLPLKMIVYPYIYICTHTLILSLSIYIYLYIHSCGSQGNFDPDLYPFWLLTATVPFCFRPFGRTRWAVRWPDAALHGGDQNQWAFWWTRQLLNLRPSNKANSLKHIYGLVYTYGSQIFHNWSIWSQSWSPFMDIYIYIYIHSIYIYIYVYIWLVVDLPLWKIWKSDGMILPNIWENKKCSKPPTSIYIYIYGLVYICGSQIFHTWSIWSQSQSPFMDKII